MAENETIIEDKKVVTLAYILKSDDGEILDETTPDDSLLYLHGAENIVPGLESELVGKKVGDKFTVHVVATEAYGERGDSDLMVIERSEFPEDMDVEFGMQLFDEDDKGNLVPMWVVENEGGKVTLDFNHPLAGFNLNFEGEVLAIRDASEEEVEHAHPHGADGHEGHDH